ncbi:MAG: acyl-CoA dehydrogenase family protein [Chloroflexi bacterium]|nr:acyl-CoA dehydrogenase family protein [Chloroflexota bacterium]
MTTGRDELPADYLGYELPDSLKMLRQLSRDFNQNEIIPLERDLDYDAYHVPEEVGRDLQRKAKEAGLWNMSVPKEWGGEGMDIFTMTVVDEERVKHRNGLYGAGYGAYGGGPPAILYRHATQDQVERFVLPSLAGERRGFFAITEPGGGSDPARAIATHATRDGDDWVINGSKMFISGSLEADYGLVFCRTDTEAGRGGISCMIVEKGMPGYTVEPIAVIRPDYPGMLSFQDVRVRKAVSLWLDRQSAADAIEPGTGATGTGLWLPGQPWTNPDLLTWPGWNTATKAQDREEAKRLMAEAGFADGFDIELSISATTTFLQPAEFAVSDLRGLGINANIKIFVVGPWENLKCNGEYDFLIDVYTGLLQFPDSTFGAVASVASNPCARTWHNDSRVDDLFRQIIASGDLAERIRLSREVEKLLVDDGVYIAPMYTRKAATPLRSYVKGFQLAQGLDSVEYRDNAIVWLDK